MRRKQPLLSYRSFAAKITIGLLVTVIAMFLLISSLFILKILLGKHDNFLS